MSLRPDEPAPLQRRTKSIPPDLEPIGMGALVPAREFVTQHWLKLLVISAALLVPCLWHRHIEAGDLASHVYNAWLAQLIEHGQAPGLWISHPWTNVLFDYILSGLGHIFGLEAAEKISVALAALIFFWGSFALVSAATRRAPWFLTPLLAMVSYGWTFELGFFNYYMAIGLSFFALAILWRGKGWERVWAIALMPLIAMAHPLGLIWLLAAAAYIWMAESKPLRSQPFIVLAAAGIIFLLRVYLRSHFEVSTAFDPLYTFNGGDQLVLFGGRYKFVELLLGIFAIAAVATDLITRRREPGIWRKYAVPLELYVLVEAGVFLLPDSVRVPNHPAALALLTERLSSVSAVLVCCILGSMVPRRWHLLTLWGIAVIFFSCLYEDTGTVNRMEAEVAELVRTLPPGQRVLATILKQDDSRVLVQHILDRACIGHCFSYGNYEPSSEVFRIRASPGNPYVMIDFDQVGSMEEGTYEVQADDLPAYQIYQCNPDWTKLCIRPLKAGEANDSQGVHPEE